MHKITKETNSRMDKGIFSKYVWLHIGNVMSGMVKEFLLFYYTMENRIFFLMIQYCIGMRRNIPGYATTEISFFVLSYFILFLFCF